jgi:hypothetical protein
MAGLVPAIHALLLVSDHKDVDARDKPGHDETKRPRQKPGPSISAHAAKNQRE